MSPHQCAVRPLTPTLGHVSTARVSSPKDRAPQASTCSTNSQASHRPSVAFPILSRTVRNRNMDKKLVDNFSAKVIVVGMRARATKCVLRPSGGVDKCSNEIDIITFGL